MGLIKFVLPALGLGLGATLLTPDTSEGFSLIGFSLSQSQRDFRVFNNFSDASANNNQTPHPNFPGAQGAVMAIWKGSVEWGSSLHGNGNGDPSQSGDLGSGGGNFDPSYQGLATGVGGINDNIHSELSGSGGGVLAFTESPSSNGWRIRYYSSWSWNDGPGTNISGIDLQGVACHEYGHAIGLGHSGNTGATMFASIIGSGVQARSINGDDAAGVQAAYGAANPSKPIITGYALNGSQITVTGSNFNATNNQIWFTQATAGGNGVPIKVTGLTSDGTTLTATVPNNAGPGDILVRRNATGNAGLSNAWPFDPGSTTPGCGFTTYGTGLGGANIGVIDSTSTPDVGTTVAIDISGFTGGTAGQVILSLNQGSTPFANGTILVDFQNPAATFNFAASGSGTATVNIPIPNNPAIAFLPTFLQAGTIDGSLPGGWAFSNGLQMTLCP